MAIQLTFVRHGPTDFNDNDRLRGWMDPPLNQGGMVLAREAGEKLKENVYPVYSSDLLRAHQTASFINAPRLTLHKALRPWNVGVYAGKPGKDVHPLLLEYYRYPDLCVPFGEPFLDFVHRYTSFLRSLTENSVIVTHFRNCKLAQAWAAGSFKTLDMKVLAMDDVKPASIFTMLLPF